MTPEQFIAVARIEPFAWERHSCAHLVDRWLRLRTGKSFLDGYDCSTEAKAEALMARTPLPVMLARSMRRLGFVRTANPETGDIGAIVIPPFAICAVKGSRLWLYRSADGFGAASDVRLLAAWSIS